MSVECAGCAEGLTFPHQHATLCPVFKHADVKRMADFLECGCGHLCVTNADYEAHLHDVSRRIRCGLPSTP